MSDEQLLRRLNEQYVKASLAGDVEWYRSHDAWWKPIKSGAFRAYYEKQYSTNR